VHDVALISALYGDYDSLKTPVYQSGDVQYVCLTDNPDVTSDVWEMVYWPKPHQKPLLAAKAPKMLPAWHCDARASVWVDMSVQVLNSDFALEAAECAKDGVATWPHPWNPDLATEAAESVQQVRYQGQRLLDQVERFWDEGLPADASVRHTAVVARTHNDVTEQLGLRWDAEYEWSAADQIGFVYACWKTGVPMYDLPMDQAFLMGFRTPSRSDPWLSHHSHLKGYTA
jgi:hypothetical protein